ncbi:MAG: c-type cytochrome [Polyangiaceae bacterium]|nr:c-type cytochrome [Polyangiaceae bacterium]
MNRKNYPSFEVAISLGLTALFLPSCVYEKMEDAECPSGGTTLTYENFGQDFFAKYCNYCHGASVEDRQSAPPAYVFDTEAQVEKWAERIYIRAAGRNETMPPGPDDPPREERDKLAEWLVCTYGD